MKTITPRKFRFSATFFCLFIAISLLLLHIVGSGENHRNWTVASYNKKTTVIKHCFFANRSNRMDGISLGAVSVLKGKVLYSVKVDSLGKESINWLYGPNGPQRMKLDATKKFFIVEADYGSFWAWFKHESAYAWFKLWH